MKTYEIVLIVGSGFKTVYYHDTEPLADFEKRMTQQYGDFIMHTSKEVVLP